jgi:Dolichyl-phosphate-mannose-protein mannosyltransferase
VRRYALLAIVLLGAAVRAPFWAEALRTPADDDTAIIGLMARHPLASTTMWGQPYGSPLDAWLAVPALAIFGHKVLALRLLYFALGLVLIPLAAALALALDRRAAIPAALLMACPTPYFLLLAALPPPFYSSVLLLCGLLLLLALRLGERLENGARPRAALVVWGLVAGLALWTHLMTAVVVVAAALYLLRSARRLVDLAPSALAALGASAPLWWRALRESQALRIVSVSGRQEGMLSHLRELLPEMHRPLTAILGTHVPWVADNPYFIVFAPTIVAAVVVLIYGGFLLLAALTSRFRGGPGLLLAAILLTIAAFPLPLRANPSAIRFLTPLYLPLVALVAWAAVVRLGSVRRAVAVALVLSALHLVVGARLLHAWRGADRAEAPFLLPDLAPLRHELDALGVRRVYASYGPAYRLTFESDERVIATQPWNERFLHYPLPYLDEVRFARNVAWVLTPTIPSDLPTPREMEDQLGAIGGRFTRSSVGGALIFHGFSPPFGPTVTPLAGGGGSSDPVTWVIDPPRPLAGVTLVAGLGGPRLPRGFDLETSVDGRSFERVVRRRRQEERRDLRWVNGHPQYVIDDDLVAVALPGGLVAAVRLTPVDSGEWAVAELLLHAPGGNPVWDEWLDPNLRWPERRRTLESHPRLDREDWYYRRLLADRRR